MRGKALPRGNCPDCGRHLVLTRDGAIPPHKVRLDGWWGPVCHPKASLSRPEPPPLWSPGTTPPTHGNNVVAVTGTGKERRLFTARYQGGEWVYFCPTPIIIDPPQWWADMPESQ